MKNRTYLSLLFFLVAVACYAQVPTTINYQGFLAKPNGDPVDNNQSFTVKFSFLDIAGSPIVALGTREVVVQPVNGLFTAVIGSGSTVNNQPLPTTAWSQPIKIQLSVNNVDVGTPVSLTSVPYAFMASTVNAANISGSAASLPNTLLDTDLQDLADGTLSGAKVGTGIEAANITTGTISNAVLDDDLDDLVDGSLSGSKVGTGISATNITIGTLSGSLVGTGVSASNVTTGTLPNGVLDADLQDLADGSLAGSKVGSGIDAANITTGTISNAVLDDDLDDLVDGSLSGSKVGTGIDAANITTGTISNAVLDDDLDDLVDGSLSGSKIGTGISAANVTTGTLPNTVLDAEIQDLADGTLAAINVDGFTKLGSDAPVVKMKKLTGTTSGSASGTVGINHGLTSTKVLDVAVMVEYSAGNFVPSDFISNAGYNFNWYLTPTQVVVANIDNAEGTSTNVRGKNIVILITYEQ
ncbi:MAG: hypothetical protein ACOYXT_07070 [Bacteroidota bacterium]